MIILFCNRRATETETETEMEMEMEMRASEEIQQGEDITPPLYPLTFALHDSCLDTHCSSCFCPLPCSSPYCSSLPISSASTSDLRAALRLLLLSSPPLPPPRLFGLLTNRDKLLSSSDSDVASKIRAGALEIAKARGNLSNDIVWEEAALCLVMTNAVEVHDDKSGRALGIAVYDKHFSWINHSCSPNACYRFLLSPANTTSFCEALKIRLSPHLFNTTGTDAETLQVNSIFEENGRYGPRIIVRSIKPINKGEAVTVAYTDLLQPKAMRLSELWEKYQFVCCCRRCITSPPTNADRVLEEISVPYSEFSSLSSDYKFDREEANQKLVDFMDEVISEYLSVGDPEACCKKLENMLTQGLQCELLEMEEGKLPLNFRLRPLHHLALNAYTALASAYKIRSIDLLALHSDIDGRCRLEAFDMSRTSAAYSFLVAGATDYLFRSESSLIASAANFWASAGESLLTLARSSEWDLFVKSAFPVSISSLEKHKCSNCLLMDRFQVNLFCQARNADFEDISSEFLDCTTKMTRKVWGFLIHGCGYLQMIKDPIDFNWLGKFPNIWNFEAHLYCTDEDSDMQLCNKEVRINIFQLGVHCLVYGGYLANICYGDSSHLTCHIKNVLYNEKKSAHC